MKKRFTLLELLVLTLVIAIIGALFPVSCDNFSEPKGLCKANIARIGSTAAKLHMEMGAYPSPRPLFDAGEVQAERYAKLLFLNGERSSKDFMCPSCQYQSPTVDRAHTTLTQKDVSIGTGGNRTFRYDARLREVVDYSIAQRNIPERLIGTHAYVADGYRGEDAPGMSETRGHNHKNYGNAYFLDGSAQTIYGANWYLKVAGVNALTDKDSGILLY